MAKSHKVAGKLADALRKIGRLAGVRDENDLERFVNYSLEWFRREGEKALKKHFLK